MSPPLTSAQAAELLYREAEALDGQRWDDWLALFTEDAVYWVPTWVDEHQPADDPDRQLSLIHYASRAGLEDRVWRIRSGLSVASEVLPRTAHLIGNVRVDDAARAGPDEVIVHSVFTVQRFDLRARASHAFFGRYQHRLRRTAQGWRIAGKTIHLLNDLIPTMLDVYCL